jgi:hypothetical protein
MDKLFDWLGLFDLRLDTIDYVLIICYETSGMLRIVSRFFKPFLFNFYRSLWVFFFTFWRFLWIWDLFLTCIIWIILVFCFSKNKIFWTTALTIFLCAYKRILINLIGMFWRFNSLFFIKNFFSNNFIQIKCAFRIKTNFCSLILWGTQRNRT